ncbi:ribonuclease HI [Novosphingobium sp.]|uniref:ribonuclease HI n=1 Tax=Novosphingobium sp. TaxID=1874826 RepID=UPI003D148C8A
MRRVKVFFDGGARPNPGPIEVAVVVRGAAHVFDDLGEGTSHDAEWLALIHALKLCQAQDLRDFVLIGDALAVVTQANQALAPKSAPAGHAATFVALARVSRPAHIRWVKRQQNLAGIVLAARHPR